MKTSLSISKSSLEWMPKSVWGPMKWKELHTRALCYLPMAGERDWFESFVAGLPCPHCRHHFQVFLQENAPDLSTRPAFFRWTVNAHNYVNRSLGRPQIAFSQALELHVGSVFEKG